MAIDAIQALAPLEEAIQQAALARAKEQLRHIGTAIFGAIKREIGDGLPEAEVKNVVLDAIRPEYQRARPEFLIRWNAKDIASLILRGAANVARNDELDQIEERKRQLRREMAALEGEV